MASKNKKIKQQQRAEKKDQKKAKQKAQKQYQQQKKQQNKPVQKNNDFSEMKVETKEDTKQKTVKQPPQQKTSKHSSRAERRRNNKKKQQRQREKINKMGADAYVQKRSEQQKKAREKEIKNYRAKEKGVTTQQKIKRAMQQLEKAFQNGKISYTDWDNIKDYINSKKYSASEYEEIFETDEEKQTEKSSNEIAEKLLDTLCIRERPAGTFDNSEEAIKEDFTNVIRQQIAKNKAKENNN